MGKTRLKLTDQIRRAVDDSGMTRYAICKALGVPQSSMSRFMSGRMGLSFDNLDALAELLDLNITAGKRRTKKG